MNLDADLLDRYRLACADLGVDPLPLPDLAALMLLLGLTPPTRWRRDRPRVVRRATGGIAHRKRLVPRRI